jgi:pyruvate dehydrogenase complex dehydrogenase (E1) component
MIKPPPDVSVLDLDIVTRVEDVDPVETREWIDAFDAVIERTGLDRGLHLLRQIERRAQTLGGGSYIAPFSAYRNTIALDDQAPHPGDVSLVAATDYVCAYPHLIAAYVPGRFVALGTDGFGRSDTRAALRRFFEVDRYHVVIAALHALSEEDKIPQSRVSAAIEHYRIAADLVPPWTC